MSMLDSFFNKGFKATKCKTLLKLTIPRIKLLRNRREIQIKQMRKDIAKLLETGQEATARIRVEHIVREENMMAAQEIIELFCELVAVRLPIIESQRECPLDLKEAIASICFAAPRCADLPELLQVQMAFVSKYGKEFVAAATELMPDCGVNRQLVELLSVRAPSPEKKMKLLREIAEEHGLDWDPASSEVELFKSHEDLLNGPTQFIGGSKVPVPKEIHEVPQFTVDQGAVKHSDSEEDFDELEFPEVPNVSLRPGRDAELAPSQPSAPHPEPFHASATETYSEDKLFHHSIGNPENNMQAASLETPEPSADVGFGKQFLPFIRPPSPSLTTPPPSSSPAAPAPSLPPAAPPVLETEASNLARTKSDATVDLNDVLAAAKAAAESAERSAAAARSAASLVEMRISELSKSNRGQSPGKDSENPFHTTNENVRLDETLSGESHNLDPSSKAEYLVNNQTENKSEDATVGVFHQNSSPPAESSFKEDPSYHQPQKMPSMDDDYFAYPNLFSSQSGDTSPSIQSPDNHQSRHGF